jgi:hypothetical protein
MVVESKLFSINVFCAMVKLFIFTIANTVRNWIGGIVLLGLKVEKHKDHLMIRWQLSKIEIPISEIVEVPLDDTYVGLDKTAIRIGTPYGTTDRVVIKTKTDTFILYTTKGDSMKNKIHSFLNNQ